MSRKARARKARVRRLIYGTAVIFSALFVLSALSPLFIVEAADTGAPEGSYGVYSDIARLQDERYDPTTKARVEGESGEKLKDLYKAIGPEEPRPTPTINEVVTEIVTPEPSIPGIITTIGNSSLINRTTIFQTLLDQPLSYYIYTESKGHEAWTKGLLRPNFEPSFQNGRITILDWDKWVDIDADGDTATGDDLGRDIRARIDIKLNDLDLNLGGLLDPTEISGKGAISFQFERLEGNNTTTGPLPLKIHFAKSVSYVGSNFLWTLGFEFDDAPYAFNMTISADGISLSRPTFGESFTKILDWFNQLMNDPANATFNFSAMEIHGPYLMNVWMDTPVNSMYVALTYSKMESQALFERTWIEVTVGAGPGATKAPTQFSLGLDSPSLDLPFDELEWRAIAKSAFDARFYEEKTNQTYGMLHIPEMPTYFFVGIDRPTADGSTTKVTWRADDVIPLIEFREFEYFLNGSTVDRDTFRSIQANIYDMPKTLYLEGTFSVGSGDDPKPQWNSPPMMTVRLLDSMMLRFIAKLYRVARVIRDMPQNIVDMPMKDGYMDLQIPDNGTLGGVDFILSSDTQVDANVEGDFLAFHNDSERYEGTDFPIITSSLTGRLLGIKGLHNDFREGTTVNIISDERRPLQIIFIDEPAEARATFKLDTLPTDVEIHFEPGNISFRGDTVMQFLTYESIVEDQYFKLALEDVPLEVRISQVGGDQGSFELNTVGGAIGSLEITVTNSYVRSMDPDKNHLFLMNGSGSYLASARLLYLTSLRFQRGTGGVMETKFAEERPLYIYLRDDSAQLLDEVYLDPFPSSLSVSLPGMMNATGLRLPNALNIKSIFEFTPVMVQLSSLGKDIAGTLEDLTANLATQMGSIGMNTTLEIFSTKPATLIASIQKGDTSKLHEVSWNHGVSVAIDRVTGSVNGRVFLKLPTITRLVSSSTDTDMNMTIDFGGFVPAYPSLSIEIWGMGERDVSVYLNGFPEGTPVDLNINVSLSADMTPGTGFIKAAIKHKATLALGQLWVNMWNRHDTPSITTVYMSALPSTLDATMAVGDGLKLDWKTSKHIEAVYFKSTRKVDNEWADVYAIVHDVPQDLSFQVRATDDYDMEGSPLQTLPLVTVSALSATLDLHVFEDGRAMGQPSTYEVHMMNVASNVETTFSGGKYTIRSEGTDLIYIRVQNMPFFEDVDIVQLTMFAEGVVTATMEVPMAFGTFPVIRLTDLEVDDLQIYIRHRMSVMGNVRIADLALVDLSRDGWTPLPARIMYNGAHVTEGTDHTIVPAPLMTLFRTLTG